eukprot:SAG31_NODE_2396_length_5784_cov_15.942656_2_plen_35_part_00
MYTVYVYTNLLSSCDDNLNFFFYLSFVRLCLWRV